VLCAVLWVRCVPVPTPTSEALSPALTPTVSPPTPEALTPTPEMPTPLPTLTAGPDPYREARLTMVARQIEGRGVSDKAVLEAMRAVPRHLFVPNEWIQQAYADHPLPIGYGQTISQPFIVAWMTELLELESGERVLEIGTGSGYQAAVLGELKVEVYTIEIIEALTTQASDRLAEMGYDNVVVRHADGYFGWEEHAPFDAIIVTCAPDHIPPPLVGQLKEGGHMVVPVGPPGGYQSLFLITKENGEVKSQSLGGVRFVPLTRSLD
jgi:protein-L-isoaspartate(D-aspartate) O-methyltransferase